LNPDQGPLEVAVTFQDCKLDHGPDDLFFFFFPDGCEQLLVPHSVEKHEDD
jgi:hypothetical protein